MTFDALTKIAEKTLHPWQLTDNTSAGTVAAALLTEAGNVYTGVCIDVSSGIGFCAEHAAIGAMITAGENRILRMVAVRATPEGARVIAPCGRCREFVVQIHEENIHCEVRLSGGVVSMAALLPHRWDD